MVRATPARRRGAIRPASSLRSGASSANSSGQDLALPQVDQAVAARFAEPEDDVTPAPFGLQAGAAAGARGREMWWADVGGQALLGERMGDAIGDELRVARVVEMLELAAAAVREMAAGWGLVVRAGGERAILRQHIARCGERGVAAGFRHTIAARGDADDQFSGIRRWCCGISGIRSSAMKAGPARSAMRVWSQTASQAAMKGSAPCPASRAATRPARTSPVPAVESQGEAWSLMAMASGEAMTVWAPLWTIVAPVLHAAAWFAPACRHPCRTCGRIRRHAG